MSSAPLGYKLLDNLRKPRTKLFCFVYRSVPDKTAGIGVHMLSPQVNDLLYIIHYNLLKVNKHLL